MRLEVEYLRVIVLRDARQADLVKKPFTVPIEIKLPSFRDENRDSPMEFMRSFDQYCSIKDVPCEFVPILLESALKERAGLWFQVVKKEIDDMDEFRNAFVNEFFSIEIKTRAKDAWRNRKYLSAEGSLLSFFYKQKSEIDNIDPTMQEYEINYIISKQLPIDVQIGLSAIDLKETKKMTHAISRMDDAWRQGYADKTDDNHFWSKPGYVKGRNERYVTDNTNNWGTNRNDDHAVRSHDFQGKKGRNEEASTNDNFRENPWRQRNEEDRFENSNFRNRLAANNPNPIRPNNEEIRDMRRNQDFERAEGHKRDYNRRVAAVQIFNEQPNETFNSNADDANEMVVQAVIRNLN